MKKPPLTAIVFVCGASTMALELTGSRIVAPYVGTSIYVWTNLIGVILGFMSLGYAWGGRLADRRPDASLLSLVVFAAALWTAGLAVFHDPVLALVASLAPAAYAYCQGARILRVHDVIGTVRVRRVLEAILEAWTARSTESSER